MLYDTITMSTSTKSKIKSNKFDNPYKSVLATPISQYVYTAYNDKQTPVYRQFPAYVPVSHTKLVQALSKQPIQPHTTDVLYDQYMNSDSNITASRVTELYSDKLSDVDVSYTPPMSTQQTYNTEKFQQFITAFNIYSAIMQLNSTLSPIDIQPNRINTTNGLYCVKLYSTINDTAVSVIVNDTLYIDATDNQCILPYTSDTISSKINLWMILLIKAIVNVSNKPINDITVDDILYTLLGTTYTQYTTQQYNLIDVLDQQQSQINSILGITCIINHQLYTIIKHLEPIAKAKKPVIKSTASKVSKSTGEPVTEQLPVEPIVQMYDIINVATQIKSAIPVTQLDQIAEYNVLYNYDVTKYHHTVADQSSLIATVQQQGQQNAILHHTGFNSSNLITTQSDISLAVQCHATYANDECEVIVSEHNALTCESMTLVTHKFTGSIHNMVISLNAADSKIQPKLAPTPPTSINNKRASTVARRGSVSSATTTPYTINTRYYTISVVSNYGYTLNLMSNTTSFDLTPHDEPWSICSTQHNVYKHTFSAQPPNQLSVLCKYIFTVAAVDTLLCALIHTYHDTIQPYITYGLINHTTLKSYKLNSTTFNSTLQQNTVYTLIVYIQPAISIPASTFTVRLLSNTNILCQYESVHTLTQYNITSACSYHNDYCAMKSTLQCTAQCTALIKIQHDTIDCTPLKTILKLIVDDNVIYTQHGGSSIFIPYIPCSKTQTVQLSVIINPYTLPAGYQLKRLQFLCSILFISSSAAAYCIDTSTELLIEQMKSEWNKRLQNGKLSRDKYLNKQNQCIQRPIIVHDYIDDPIAVPIAHTLVSHNTGAVQTKLHQLHQQINYNLNQYNQQYNDCAQQRGRLIESQQQQQALIDKLYTSLQQNIVFVHETKLNPKSITIHIDTWLNQLCAALNDVLQLQSYKTRTVLQATHTKLCGLLTEYINTYINAVVTAVTSMSTTNDRTTKRITAASTTSDYTTVIDQLLNLINKVNTLFTTVQLNNTNYTSNETPSNVVLSLCTPELTTLLNTAYTTCVTYCTSGINYAIGLNNTAVIDQLIAKLEQLVEVIGTNIIAEQQNQIDIVLQSVHLYRTTITDQQSVETTNDTLSTSPQTTKGKTSHGGRNSTSNSTRIDHTNIAVSVVS